MERNDILSSKLIKKINRIENMEAILKKEKDEALAEIKKQLPKDTFVEMADKIIDSSHVYSNEQEIAKGLKQKEIDKQRLEYDDYIAILRIYSNMIPSKSDK